jgi:hypothetical protein
LREQAVVLRRRHCRPLCWETHVKPSHPGSPVLKHGRRLDGAARRTKRSPAEPLHLHACPVEPHFCFGSGLAR